MELRHLRYFKAVADTLSFSRAAEHLRVAQPAVSRQIVALEEEIGCPLFLRTTSRVRLTDAGRHFHKEVDRLLGQLALAVTAAQEIGKGHGDALNLGSDWRVLFPQIPEAVVRHRATHPQISVNFIEIPIHLQIDALREGRIHVGFVHKALVASRPDLESLPLFKADMKLIVSTRHRLAGERAVAMKDLNKELWLKLDEKTHPGYRLVLTQLCHEALFTPKFGRVSNSIDGMLARVAMDEGVCILPTSLIMRPHAGLRFIETDCQPFEFYAIWLKDSPAEPRTGFLKTLRQALAGAAKLKATA
jgi:LysR family transcriptional regulator, benzoate and cis,cis-muconate-responsive activator of ben and cat genes